MQRHILLIFIFFTLAISSAYGLTLNEAVNIAKKNNPQVKQAKSIWQKAQAEVVVQSTWPDPMIMITYDGVPQVRGALEDAPMKMYGFSQKIPFPGKLTLKRFVRSDMARMFYEKYQSKIWEVATKTKSAYHTLYFIRKAIVINLENEALLRQFEKIARAKYIIANASQHDLLKSRIELSLLSNELITLRQRENTAIARLNLLLNQEPNSQIKLPEKMDFPGIGLALSELEETALENQPVLLAMRHGLDSKEWAHLLSKMQYLPNFELRLLQKESKATGLNGWNTRLMASVPIWFWGKNAQVNVAGEAREEAQASLKNMENMVRFEVRDAYEKLDSSKRLIELFKSTIVPQAEQMVKAARIAYEGEKIDFLSLINSQKTLQNAKLKYFKSLADFGKNLAELERVIGKELN